MLSDSEHARASSWFRKHIGISLSEDKKYLVETRLEPVAYRYGFESIQKMLEQLTGGQIHDKELIHAVYSAITTHETSFFRDFHPFEFFKNTYFPSLIGDASREQRLSVWSAACSSGQEIYSLLLLMAEDFPELLQWKLDFAGTDVSPHTLEKARMGEYTQSEIGRGLQARLLLKYFSQLPSGNWVLNPAIRNRVRFDYHNLIESWQDLGTYDVIFIRNVLIYFEVDLKRQILEKAKQHLRPGGMLFLGSSETTANLDPDWQICKADRTIFYTLNSAC